MHNLSIMTFPSAPPQHVWHTPQGLGEQAKVTLLLRTARLNSLTFIKSPKILRARFRCMTSFTSPTFYLGFLFWHLWMTHPPRARIDTNIYIYIYIEYDITVALNCHCKSHGKHFLSSWKMSMFFSFSLSG